MYMNETLKLSGWSDKKYGQVFFYEPDYQNRLILPIGRSLVREAQEALDLYANTPNPASQIIYFNNDDERLEQIGILKQLVNNREWLDELFECI